MPKKLSPETEVLVRGVSGEGLFSRTIQNKFSELGVHIGHATVSNVTNSVGTRINHKDVGLLSPKKEQPDACAMLMPIANRKTNSQKLYQGHLSGSKSEFTIVWSMVLPIRLQCAVIRLLL